MARVEWDTRIDFCVCSDFHTAKFLSKISDFDKIETDFINPPVIVAQRVIELQMKPNAIPITLADFNHES